MNEYDLLLLCTAQMAAIDPKAIYAETDMTVRLFV